MTLYEVGRMCLKIAGRDAGRKCVVVENVDDSFVVIDGNVRRKKVNIKHLELLADVIEIKDKASHEDVKKAFDKLGISVWEKNSKNPAKRPKKQKRKKEKPVEEKKEKKPNKEKVEEKVKVEAKKEEAPKEEKLEEALAENEEESSKEEAKKE